ncbi:secreted RxLR effector protein 161-like [Primulina huaijiensis]|uniref:secreted RxLR effector protein 161-like n=1 Tax=Primulina huaijiensis TaxID=1492673 RepID=UPI003CC71BFA
MGSNEKLSKDGAAEDVDNTLYRSIIGSLMYLTASRPDLMFTVCLCARYQSNPKISHLKAIKRILRYIAGTIDLGLWYTHDTNSNLVGFSDADWAGDLDDRKSTTGVCFYLGNNLISWHSRKQNCVSLSTAESEYVAAGSGCTQLLWMKQMIEDYGLKSEPLVMYCDNSSAINISKNLVQHSRTKHIDIRDHFIRDLVEKGLIRMEFFDNNNQLADIFTKALDFDRFSNLRKSLSMCSV